MIVHLNNLPERSLSYHLMHLISISYMVSHYKLVVVLFGLEIGEYLSNLRLYFVCLMTNIVHILVIEYFSALVGCQVLLVPLQRLAGSQRQFHLLPVQPHRLEIYLYFQLFANSLVYYLK